MICVTLENGDKIVLDNGQTSDAFKRNFTHLHVRRTEVYGGAVYRTTWNGGKGMSGSRVQRDASTDRPKSVRQHKEKVAKRRRTR